MRQNIFEFDEKANAYIVRVAMPGVEKKDVTIEEEGIRIVVKVGGANPFHVQTVYITLTERIDVDGADAKLRDGVFTLTLPLEKRKRIAIG